MKNDFSKNKFDFKDKDISLVKSEVGLNEDTIRFISSMKKEDKFFLDFRLKALKEFFSHLMQEHCIVSK